MKDLVELKVVGVTRSQIQMGAYALLLEEMNGTRRIPIVVGTTEAQAIAVRLENIIPPRPLTHDLMTSVFHAFSIELSHVVITHFENGVFSSVMHLSGTGVDTELDSRTSDAISMALRTGARIFTTPEILERTSFDPQEQQDKATSEGQRLEDMSIERLKAHLQHHVDCEEYEEAARIKKIIETREAGS